MDDDGHMEFPSEKSSIVLVVMSGLPGAGKSTFANTLQAAFKVKYPDTVVFLVEYDALVKQIIPSEWKRQRLEVLDAVSHLVLTIRSGSSGREAESDKESLGEHILRFNAQALRSASRSSKIVVILDDNMYYRSMRYQVFQRAIQLRAGYCQIHIAVALGTAVRQNLLRTCPVPEEVIARMAAAFEEPNPTRYIFEQYSLVLDTVTSTSVDKAMVLVFRAMEDPPRNVDNDEAAWVAEERSKAQELNRTNLLHRADSILRLLVQTLCSLAKSQEDVNDDLRRVSSRAVGCRKKILQQLRDMANPDCEFEVIFDLQGFLTKEFDACYENDNSQ
ncbi:hypothetical protein RvY_05500 [Ramazzottius varieornatus]|uniref:AAA+ ATPase domain-containing protein n=1 Tax=Ramazzottius varieornatus TaxID=947166 RepID=A0A1D1V1X4_RAMVA|nr:hypothetical protein RvY_05500 [Ramazzottius varieornatus]